MWCHVSTGTTYPVETLLRLLYSVAASSCGVMLVPVRHSVETLLRLLYSVAVSSCGLHRSSSSCRVHTESNHRLGPQRDPRPLGEWRLEHHILMVEAYKYPVLLHPIVNTDIDVTFFVVRLCRA